MFDGYSVLIKLSLQNQVSAGLIGMSAQFTRLQAQATELQARLKSIRALALTGLGLTAAGAAGFYVLDKMIKPAEDYAHQLNIMNMAGLKQKDIANAIGDAWKNTTNVITTSATENLRMLNDMRIVFGQMGEARQALPLVAQMQAVLMSSKEGKALASDKDFAFSVAKALDIVGAVKNKNEFMTEADAMAKTITAFQGRVTPKMFQSTFAYARQAKYALDDEFKYQFLPTLMMEYAQGSGGGGGSRGVGPMIAAAYRMTNQGYINKKALPELIKLGLVAKGTELKTTTSGTTVGPMTGYQLAAKDPFLWTQQVLVPAIEKAYGHGKPMSRDDLQFHINQVFRGNQLAASLFTEFASKPYAFMRDQKLIQQAMSPQQAYQQALMNDPVLARQALSAQWENVQTALTTPIVTVLIPALQNLASGLNSLARILQAYPMLAKTLSYAFVGLSGALLFSGTVLLLSAAFKGLALTFTVLQATVLVMGAPILGIVTALGLMGYAIYKLYETLKSINWQQLGQEIVSGITSIFSSIGKAIGGKVYDFTHPDSNSPHTNLLNFSPKASPTGKPMAFNNATPQTIHVASTINLDGRQIARVVTEHQVKDATRVPNYSQGFDPSMSPTPMILKGNVA